MQIPVQGAPSIPVPVSGQVEGQDEPAAGTPGRPQPAVSNRRQVPAAYRMSSRRPRPSMRVRWNTRRGRRSRGYPRPRCVLPHPWPPPARPLRARIMRSSRQAAGALGPVPDRISNSSYLKSRTGTPLAANPLGSILRMGSGPRNHMDRNVASSPVVSRIVSAVARPDVPEAWSIRVKSGISPASDSSSRRWAAPLSFPSQQKRVTGCPACPWPEPRRRAPSCRCWPRSRVPASRTGVFRNVRRDLRSGHRCPPRATGSTGS